MVSGNAGKYKSIGLKIAYYRSQKGYTQQQLADRVGISKSYLSKIESPSTNKSFSLDVLFSICEELGVSIVKLFEDCN